MGCNDVKEHLVETSYDCSTTKTTTICYKTVVETYGSQDTERTYTVQVSCSGEEDYCHSSPYSDCGGDSH